jgi:hypothetical protein
MTRPFDGTGWRARPMAAMLLATALWGANAAASAAPRDAPAPAHAAPARPASASQALGSASRPIPLAGIQTSAAARGLPPRRETIPLHWGPMEASLYGVALAARTVGMALPGLSRATSALWLANPGFAGDADLYSGGGVETGGSGPTGLFLEGGVIQWRDALGQAPWYTADGSDWTAAAGLEFRF